MIDSATKCMLLLPLCFLKDIHTTFTNCNLHKGEAPWTTLTVRVQKATSIKVYS